MAEVKEKLEKSKSDKSKRETYFIMKRVLKSQKIGASVETFPSDQFIIKNLPESIRKTEGASKPVKTALIAGAVAGVAIIGGVIAPAAMFAFGAISTTALAVSGAVGAITAIGGFFKAKGQVNDIKKHAPNIAKRLMAKHIVSKAHGIKQSWKDNKEKRKQEERALKAEKALENMMNNSASNDSSSKVGSVLLGSLKVKDAWDKAITDDSKEKIKKGLNSAKDTALEVAEDTVKVAKNKLGSMLKNFRKK